MDKLLTLTLALLLAAGAAGAEEAELARHDPIPGTILRLNQQHHAGDWLRVKMDSLRIETRARSFDAHGLVGLSPRDRSLQLPEPLPWTRVERIDVLRHRRARGAVLGALAGAVITVAAARSGDFAIGGALGGGLLGGGLGDRLIHEEELYRAPARTPEPSPSRSSEPGPSRTSEPTPALAAADSAELDPAAVDRVARLISPKDLLRIGGDFGRRFGHVASVGPNGLEGFRPEHSLERGGSPADLIPWSRIQTIDKRAGSAGSGAMHGAITLGLAGGLLTALVAAAAISLAQSDAGTGAVVGAGLAGAGVCAGVGALFGAGVGAAIPSWHVVYERR